MSDPRPYDQESDFDANESRSEVKRRVISLVILVAALVGFFATLLANRQMQAATRSLQTTQIVNQDYSTFSHQSSSHASQQCAACHRREADNSARPSLPGHKSCTGCHLAQFVTPDIPMCVICHTSVSSGGAPVKAFPGNFKESFNLKFDHAQHLRGAARPSNGCISCHDKTLRKGVALTIPVGLSAHNQCYACHTPRSQTASGRDMGSCSTCHDQAPYARTSTDARAFRFNFSHADHGVRQRLGCTDCHSVTAGLSQSRQVSLPRAEQHFPTGRGISCAACHNGKRAFGDLDFGDCRRCHKGPSFRMPT